MVRFFLLWFLFYSPLLLHSRQSIYSTVVTFKSFVVGRDNRGTGLHRFMQDTSWAQLGWKTGRTFGVAIHPSKPNFIFLACGNGVLRSLDRGDSWRITTDWRVTEVLDLCIDPFDANRIYFASAYGVWQSRDLGDTWEPAGSGLDHKYVQTIAADQAQAQRLLVGGETGLYISENGARNWSKISQVQVPVRDLYQCVASPELWLAGTEDQGVLISRDHGKSWQFVRGKIARETIYAVTVNPANPQQMAAGGYQTGIYLSADGGKKWKQTRNGLTCLDIHALAFDLEQSGRIWVGTLGGGMFYSDDFGKNWIYAGLDGGEIWDMQIIEEK